MLNDRKCNILQKKNSVQSNMQDQCFLDTVSDLVGKVDGKARKPRITKEIINKVD
jgi:hypothetical protein